MQKGILNLKAMIGSWKILRKEKQNVKKSDSLANI